MANPFEDSPYFKIVPMKPWVPTPLAPNELFRGASWSVFLEPEGHVLDWMSGELSGRSRRTLISKSEAEKLIAGEASADEVLRAHGF